MAGTMTIPLTTLPVGTQHFPASGGFSLADTDTEAQLTIDRTVAGGFNSAPATTEAAIEVDQSNDGGSTWFQLAATTFFGGIYQTKANGGGQLNANGFTVTPAPGTGRLARATVTISGAAVAVAGSLVIS